MALYRGPLLAACSEELDQELGIEAGGALWALGRLLTELGDYTEARRTWTQHLLSRCETGNHLGIIASLEEHSVLALAQGQWERAGRLWGAAAGLRDQVGSFSQADKEHEDRTKRLRAILGEEALALAFAAGRSLTKEQAIAYALEGAEEARSAMNFTALNTVK